MVIGLTPRPLTSGFASNGCVQTSVVLMVGVREMSPCTGLMHSPYKLT